MTNRNPTALAIDFAHFSGASYFLRPFFSDQICLVVSQSHPRIRGKISSEQFYREKHITLKLRRENTLLADYFTEERLQPRTVSAECDSLLALMALVAGSESIGMVSTGIARQFSQQFGLQVLKAPFFSVPINYKLLAHNREQNSKANRWLREKLLSYTNSAF